MKSNKRAIVGLTTFSLLILIFISIFIGSFYFASKFKTNAEELNSKVELENSLYSLRSSLLELTFKDNSSENYSNKFDSNDVIIEIDNSTMSGIISYGNVYIEENISSMGIEFCSNYNISPTFNSDFFFNGSCISKE